MSLDHESYERGRTAEREAILRFLRSQVEDEGQEFAISIARGEHEEGYVVPVVPRLPRPAPLDYVFPGAGAHVARVERERGPCPDRMVRERDALTIVAALVKHAGGSVTLSPRELVDAFGLDVEWVDDVATGARRYRTWQGLNVRPEGGSR